MGFQQEHVFDFDAHADYYPIYNGHDGAWFWCVPTRAIGNTSIYVELCEDTLIFTGGVITLLDIDDIGVKSNEIRYDFRLK